MSVFVRGSGTYVPERAVSNEELAPQLGLDPEWIFKASGIRSRRRAAEGETAGSLGARALRAALDDASLEASEVDYLLFGTMTPDRFIPGSAYSVQREAGLGEIPCLDIRATCCNALYGLQLARALVASGAARNVAVCLAEVQSPWLQLKPEAGTISMLFGDGASALLVSGASVDASGERPARALEVLDVLLASNGAFVDDLGVRRPGTEFGAGVADPSDEARADFFPRMNGQSVILHASRRMVAACRAVLERNGVGAGDVRWVVPHQANSNLLAQVARGLGFQREGGVVSVLEQYGNTSSASMGIALDTLRRTGELCEGDLVLLPAFGAGFTWGAGLCRAA